MRSRKLLVFLLLILMVQVATAYDIPDLALPDAPEEQPGDSEEFTITVGEARRALYYKEAYPILIAYIEDLKARLVEEAQVADSYRVQAAEFSLEADSIKFQRNIGFGISVAEFLLLLAVGYGYAQ